MGKFYAVRVGKIPGIYNTWDEASDMVTGYKGAIYKKFDNLSDAQEFINEETPVEKEVKYVEKTTEEGTAIAYTDGSYKVEDNSISYGSVVILDGKLYEISQRFKHHPYAKYRNVAGELYGALEAMQTAYMMGAEKLLLHHDYEGIGSWADGEWKSNTDIARNYKEYVDRIRKHMKVVFIKVEAHSGITLNERADDLATMATDSRLMNIKDLK